MLGIAPGTGDTSSKAPSCPYEASAPVAGDRINKYVIEGSRRGERLEKGGYQSNEHSGEGKLGEAAKGVAMSREHCRGQKARQGIGAEAKEVTSSALRPLSK